MSGSERSERPDGSALSFDPRIVLRPRSLDETLDLALIYSRTHHRDLIRLFLGVTLWGVLLALAMRVGFGAGWSAVWAASFFSIPIVELVVIAAAGNHLFRGKVRVSEAVRKIASRGLILVPVAILIPLPWAIMVATEFETGWLVLATMMGTFWPLALAGMFFFPIVLVLESTPLRRSLQRSSELIRYRYGRGLWFMLVALSIRVGFVYLAEAGGQFLISWVLQLGTPLEALQQSGGSYLSIAGFFAAAPLIAFAKLFDYVDARTRLEGWDIHVRFKALARRAGERSGRREAA